MSTVPPSLHLFYHPADGLLDSCVNDGQHRHEGRVGHGRREQSSALTVEHRIGCGEDVEVIDSDQFVSFRLEEFTLNPRNARELSGKGRVYTAGEILKRSAELK